MKFLARFGILVYATVMIFIAVSIFLFIFHFITLKSVLEVTEAVYFDQDLQIFFGLLAAVILFVNYLFFKANTSDRQRGKIIAFDNPGGRVTVSVHALEDMIRRVVSRRAEVREIRAAIKAVKRRLLVRARITLRADVNIPEITSSLQDLIKSRIQDMIGIEETVDVRIDVVKIIPISAKIKKAKEDEAEDISEAHEPTVPFRGYRA